MAKATKATATETTETPAEATETPATETEEVVIDLTAFAASVDAALETTDETTGTVPEAGLATTLAAYRDLPNTKNKNAARTALDEQTRDAVMGGNIMKARSLVMIKENLSSGASKSTSAPKDPTEAFTQRVAQLSAAYSLVVGSVPEGVAEDWEAKSQAKASELIEAVQALDPEGDLTDVPADVKKVVKLSAGSASGRFSGVRRNTNKHLEQVFAGLEPGSFLTVTEISKATSEEYGDDHPTTGAVSARLFPKSGKPELPEGIEAVVPEDGTARGARKIA